MKTHKIVDSFNGSTIAHFASAEAAETQLQYLASEQHEYGAPLVRKPFNLIVVAESAEWAHDGRNFRWME